MSSNKQVWVLFLLLCSIGLRLPCAGQLCHCKALLPVNLQPRGEEKNVHIDSIRNQITRQISIQDIYAWQKRYQIQTNAISWKPSSPKSKRLQGTPEDSIYVVKGYLWFVHQIKFDCDYHIEIGDSDSSSTRIIIEVPAGNPSVQLKIRQHLDSLHLPIMGCTETSLSRAHFKKGLPVLVTGYGFYDSFHKVNKNHGDAHTNKYIWEIHPVTQIVFLKDE